MVCLNQKEVGILPKRVEIKRNYTIETRLSLTEVQKRRLEITIDEYGDMFRYCWAREDMLGIGESKFRTHLQQRFNADSRASNTVIKTVLGRRKALKELWKFQKEQLRIKISDFEEKIKGLSIEIDKILPDVIGNTATKSRLRRYRRLKNSIWNKRQKLNRFRQRIAVWDGTNEPTVTWGTKKLAKARHFLEANGFKSFKAWNNAFHRARNSQVRYIGARAESYCNNRCQIQYDEGADTFRVQIRQTLGLERFHGKYLIIEGVDFKYQKDLLIRLIEKKQSPITVTILRRGHKWYMQVNFSLEMDVESMVALNKGAIGLDFNDGFIELSETDYYGNLVAQKRYDLPKGGSANAKLTAVRQTVAKIVKHSQYVGKGIVIEDLSFKKKRAKLSPAKSKKGKQYNKMLSSLDTMRYMECMANACVRNNVYLKKVSPAYTSKIGKDKYAEPKKLTVHQAASYVIARRGQGYREGMRYSKKVW